MFIALGVVTLASSTTTHRLMVAHTAAEAAGVEAAPGSDHQGERHPGMGVHLAGACAAILAAALVVLGLVRNPARGPRATEGLIRHTVRGRHTDVADTAGVGPPRVSLCVELR